MDVSVVDIWQIVRVRWSSDVAFFVEVASEVDAVYDLSEAEDSDVEFAHWWLVPVEASH